MPDIRPPIVYNNASQIKWPINTNTTIEINVGSWSVILPRYVSSIKVAHIKNGSIGIISLFTRNITTLFNSLKIFSSMVEFVYIIASPNVIEKKRAVITGNIGAISSWKIISGSFVSTTLFSISKCGIIR